MEKRTHIIAPQSIIFQEKAMLLLYEGGIKEEIPYSELIIVYLAVKDKYTSEIYMPCLSEVSSDMDGYILIYGRTMDYELHTYKTLKMAGELFIELAQNARQGLFGYEPWIEELRLYSFEEAEMLIFSGQV